MAENKIFTDEEILKALNNIKEIVQSQKELNQLQLLVLMNIELILSLK